MTSAKEFALAAHEGQTYGDLPYSSHLQDVVDIVHTVSTDIFLETVAWLHDVLEDTAVTPEELTEAFGEQVCMAVLLLTDPPGRNRKERKGQLHRRLSEVLAIGNVGTAALIVKAADRLANVRFSKKTGSAQLAMYRREHPEFRYATYRIGLCDALWSNLDDLLGVGNKEQAERVEF